MTEEIKAEKPAARAAEPATVTEAPRRSYGWLSFTIAAIFGLFYAYDAWEAVGNLIDAPKIYAALGLEAQTPWILFIAALLVPLLTYGLALLLGIRRRVGERALLLLAGLAASNALALGAIAENSRLFSELIHRI